MEASLHLCTYSTRRTWSLIEYENLVSLWPFNRCKGRMPTINFLYKQVSFLILGTFRYLMISITWDFDFDNMGKLRRFGEFIWSLWFLFHSGPTSDSLPLLPRVSCKFKLNLSAEALQKNYSGNTLSSQNAQLIDNAWKPSRLYWLQKCIGQRKL